MNKKIIAFVTAALIGAVSAFAADTYNLTVGGTNTMPAIYAGGTYVLESPLVSFTASDTGTASDTYQLIGIPAGTWVQKVAVEVTAKQLATANLDIGDGSDTDGWFDGLTGTYLTTNWLTMTPTVGPTNATGYSEQVGYSAFGKVYTAADTIDLLIGATASNITLKVKAFCVNFDDD